MDRRRIVNPCADALAFEVFAQRVAVVGPDRVLMIDVPPAVRLDRGLDPVDLGKPLG